MPQPGGEEISPDFDFIHSHVKVLNSQMAYIDTGSSSTATVLFLHGNPTSSYLWRNVIPLVAPKARCIAPDLIGMAYSQKPPDIEYSFADHARYLNAFVEAIMPEGQIVLVLHDWGSALGLDWARRNEHRLAGLASMEFLTPYPSWDDFPVRPRSKELFRAFRTPGVGEKMLIEENAFIEVVLPGAVVRPLSEKEMDHYRRPFLSPESRRPLFKFPNSIPIAGSPADGGEIIARYYDWLLSNHLPKLFFWVTPGSLITESKAKELTSKLHNTRRVALGPGIHYVQEDNPHLIGSEIADWLPAVLSGDAEKLKSAV